MTYDLCLWEEAFQQTEEFLQTLRLLGGERVGRLALLVAATLVADADGTSIVRAGRGSNLQQLAVLRKRAVATDVEVIADGAESASLVVSHHLFYRICLVASRGRAVEY